MRWWMYFALAIVWAITAALNAGRGSEMLVALNVLAAVALTALAFSIKNGNEKDCKRIAIATVALAALAVLAIIVG